MSPLITPTALSQKLELQGKASGNAVVVLDCRFDLAAPDSGLAQYREGHIPGAHYAHLDRDLSGPLSEGRGRHPLPEPEALAERLGRWGITATTSVVCYDGAGGGIAARAWWLLRWLGHRDVSVLDGGWSAWCANALPVETSALQPTPAAAYPWTQQALTVESDEVLDNIDSANFLLVDARAAARFRGAEEPIDPVAGHVPGAINRPFTDNLTADGCFKNPEALQAEWRALLGGKPCVAMCGSGVTACHHLLALEIAGFTETLGASHGVPKVRLYPGSWSEWIRDPKRPIARD